MEENYTGEIITNPTYFRLPDLMAIASHESEHIVHGQVEFKITLAGIIVDYDDIIMCKCRFPNRDGDTNCAACEESLEGAERLRFWRMIPNMEDVQLEITPLELGPGESD